MTDSTETRSTTARRLLRGIASATLATALVLAGCAAPSAGPDSDDPGVEQSNPGDGTNGTDGTDEGATDDSGAELGTVTVAGTTYSITELRNCEPLEDAYVESSLELQGLGQDDSGERVQIDVYIQSIADEPLDVVAWSGPEGVYGTQVHADVQLDGDRVSGSTIMVDSFTLEGEMPIEYDLAVPDELIACR